MTINLADAQDCNHPQICAGVSEFLRFTRPEPVAFIWH
jgi:hypothetical protein